MQNMKLRTLKIVHFSDLHFGSGERYGTINPESGLSRRFEDFISALDKPIDFAIKNDVDLVIFTGDTYKHATPEPVYQREFAKRIKKLSISRIPTLMVVGNHDILYKIDGSDALDIYSALDIENVIVFNRIDFKQIKTKSGTVQVIAIPHVTKSRLLTKDEYRNLSCKEQDNLMIQKVKHTIDGFVQKLDPGFPSIVIGHGTLERAQFGSEQDLSIGKVLSYPLSFFQEKGIDYVGFGHIHRHQILQEKNPLILYPGSLERVDFGEENEDKGFIYLELEKESVKYEFKSTNPRKFITIFCDLTSSQNPQEDLELEVKKKKEEQAIVRIKYKIQEENFNQIKQDQIKVLLSDCFAYLIQAEIVHKERTYRVPELDTSLTTNPILALEKYFLDYSEEDKNCLIEKAKSLT